MKIRFWLDVCIFARFKVNCEVMPLHSFAIFMLIMSRYRKELCGAPKARGPRPWPMHKSVTSCDYRHVYWISLSTKTGPKLQLVNIMDYIYFFTKKVYTALSFYQEGIHYCTAHKYNTETAINASTLINKFYHCYI